MAAMSAPLQDPFLKGGDVPPPEPPAEPPSQSARGVKTMAMALVILIGVNVALFSVLGWRVWSQRPVEEAEDGIPRIHVTLPAQAAEPLPDALSESERRTINVFRNAGPSVVFITTLTVRRDPFRRNIMTLPAGTGSGWVWDDKGHVVTNYHVIKDGQAARVSFSDQSSYSAELVGTAPDKDIAVLKIDPGAAKLTPLARGTSDNLVVGQQALAIGNPFGLDHTLSVGVVSGLNREIKSLADRPILGVIQTDAAINPGNSGGPLLDSSGRLIGINTAIYSPSGASAGIGFAVPVDTVNRIVPQLIKHGKITRPGLGISFDPNVQRRVGVQGVLVLGVAEDSPAAKAGIRASGVDRGTGKLVLGDVIIGMDDKPVANQNDLFKALDSKEVGDTVKVKIKRGSETVELDIVLAALNE
jgi:S1-C subfamily serine protease